MLGQSSSANDSQYESHPDDPRTTMGSVPPAPAGSKSGTATARVWGCENPRVNPTSDLARGRRVAVVSLHGYAVSRLAFPRSLDPGNMVGAMRVSVWDKRPYKPLAAEEIRPLRLVKDIAAGHPSAQEGETCNGGSTKRAIALCSLGRALTKPEPDRRAFPALGLADGEPDRQRGPPRHSGSKHD